MIDDVKEELPEDDRDTFLRVGDVLRRTEEHCDQIRDDLQATRETAEDPKAQLLLQSLEDRIGHLGEAVATYRESAPRAVVDTFSQYTPDSDLDFPELPDAPSLEDVVDWSVRLGEALEARYRGLSQLTMPDSVSEAFENLASLVEAEKQRIVREGTEAREL